MTALMMALEKRGEKTKGLTLPWGVIGPFSVVPARDSVVRRAKVSGSVKLSYGLMINFSTQKGKKCMSLLNEGHQLWKLLFGHTLSYSSFFPFLSLIIDQTSPTWVVGYHLTLDR